MDLKAGRLGLLGSCAAASFLLAASASPAASETPVDSAGDLRLQRLEAAVAALQRKTDDEAVLQRENAKLKHEVDELQARVANLGTGRQDSIQEIPQTAPPAVKVSLPNGRPTFSTADGRFTATLHGVMDFDGALYDQSPPGSLSSDFRRDGPALGATAANVDAGHAQDLKSGDVFRRARIGIDGTAFGDWNYRLIFDFGGSGVENAGQLYEGWVQYSGLKPVKIRIGAFAPSIGLDDQASTNGMPFLERAVSSDIARGLAAGDTRTAAEVFANGDHWLVSGAVTGRTIGSVSTGVIPANLGSTSAIGTAQTYGDQLGVVGRIAASPFHGRDWLVHFGVHGSYVLHPADVKAPSATGAEPLAAEVISLSNTPELRVDGTKLINTGSIDASSAYTVGLEFAAQKRNFLLQSEYEDIGVERTDPGTSNPNFQGYYVSATWVLTGEARRYNSATASFDGPEVSHPFSLSGGGLGAWELAVRYSDMNLNSNAGAPGTYVPTTAADAGAPGYAGLSAIRGGEEQTITAGVNWYVNPLIRFMLDYQHVHIGRLSPATTATASIWDTPAGVQIGQSYSVVSGRVQLAF